MNAHTLRNSDHGGASAAGKREHNTGEGGSAGRQAPQLQPPCRRAETGTSEEGTRRLQEEPTVEGSAHKRPRAGIPHIPEERDQVTWNAESDRRGQSEEAGGVPWLCGAPASLKGVSPAHQNRQLLCRAAQRAARADGVWTGSRS